MQKKTKSLSAFIFFIFSPLLFLIFFQNCAKQYQSELALSNVVAQGTPEPEAPVMPVPAVPELPPVADTVPDSLPLKLNDTGQFIIYRGDVIKFKFSKNDPSFPDQFAISTTDEGTAKNGVDFINTQKTLQIDSTNGFVETEIETLVSDPFSETKKLIIAITYQKNGVEKKINQEISLRTRFKSARYKAIKSGIGFACGLELPSNEIYCWGNGIDKDFYKAQPRFRVYFDAYKTDDKLDFDSIQIGTNYIVAKRINDGNFYISPRFYFASSVILNSGLPVNISIPAEVKKIALAKTFLYFTDSQDQLFSSDLAGGAQPVRIGIKISKIFGFSNHLLAVGENNQILIFTAGGNLANLPQYIGGIDGSKIVAANDKYLFMSDGKLFPLPNDIDFIPQAIVAPEIPARVLDASSMCFISDQNHWVCNESGTKNFVVVNPTDSSMYPEYISLDGNKSFCSLHIDGRMFCTGKDYEADYLGQFSYNKNARYSHLLDISASEFQILASAAAVENPFRFPTLMSAYCTASNSVLTCMGNKVFGDIQVKIESVGYLNGTIFAESYSGRKLAFNYIMASNGTKQETYTPLNLNVLDIVSPTNTMQAACNGDFILQNGVCTLAQPTYVAIANPVRVIVYPTPANDVTFDIVLGHALKKDFSFNLVPDESKCGTNLTLSTTCFPDIAAACNSAACISEYSFDWAKSFIGSSFNIPLWNYGLNPFNVFFKAGSTFARVKIHISNDLRKEKSRILNFRLEPSSPNYSGFQFTDTIQILFRKMQNPEPPADAPTFGQLVSPGGVLYQNCLRCHNTNANSGGFDMADYKSMVNKGVINLTSPLESKIYKRINPSVSPNLALPMPRDGFMTQDKIDLVNKWLTNGAKNN